MSRKDQFETTRGTMSRKRRLSRSFNDQNYQYTTNQYMPENTYYHSSGPNDIYMGEGELSDSLGYEDEFMPEQYGSEDNNFNLGYNGYQGNRPGTSQNTNNSQLQFDFDFDEQDHLPWIRFNPLMHRRIDDRRMSVPSSKGQLTIEVFYNPQDPTQFRPKSKMTKVKFIPYFLGTGHSDMLLKAHDEISSSEVESPNKEIKLLDSNIKPDSR